VWGGGADVWGSSLIQKQGGDNHPNQGEYHTKFASISGGEGKLPDDLARKKYLAKPNEKRARLGLKMGKPSPKFENRRKRGGEKNPSVDGKLVGRGKSKQGGGNGVLAEGQSCRLGMPSAKEADTCGLTGKIGHRKWLRWPKPRLKRNKHTALYHTDVGKKGEKRKKKGGAYRPEHQKQKHTSLKQTKGRVESARLKEKNHGCTETRVNERLGKRKGPLGMGGKPKKKGEEKADRGQ